MRKKVFIAFMLCSMSLFASDMVIPKLFMLEWGITPAEVEKKISNKSIGLSDFSHYQGIARRDEISDLKLSSNIMYKASGSAILNIPSEVIFTFYNSNNTQGGLKLSKDEVFLKKKYQDKTWVSVKSVFRSLIAFFCENYNIKLTQKDEESVYSRFDYEVVVNGVYANFIADIGNGRLSKDDSVFITYENNALKNQILKKELDTEKAKIKSDSDKQTESSDSDTRSKL